MYQSQSKVNQRSDLMSRSKSKSSEWIVESDSEIKEMCRRIWNTYVGVGSGSEDRDEDSLVIQPNVKTDPGYACSGCIHFDETVKCCRIFTHLPSVAFKASWFPKTCEKFKPRGN